MRFLGLFQGLGRMFWSDWIWSQRRLAWPSSVGSPSSPGSPQHLPPTRIRSAKARELPAKVTHQSSKTLAMAVLGGFSEIQSTFTEIGQCVNAFRAPTGWRKRNERNLTCAANQMISWASDHFFCESKVSSAHDDNNATPLTIPDPRFNQALGRKQQAWTPSNQFCGPKLYRQPWPARGLRVSSGRQALPQWACKAFRMSCGQILLIAQRTWKIWSVPGVGLQSCNL